MLTDMGVAVTEKNSNIMIVHEVSLTAQMYNTCNYDMFTPNPANRPTNWNEIAMLVSRINAGENFLCTEPITVDENMMIIGGHHRLEAAKICGVEIYYVIKPGMTLRDAIRKQSVETHWTTAAYIHSNMAQGFEEYKKLDKFWKEYPWLQVSMLTRLCSTQGFLKEPFKNGLYKADRVPFARIVCEMLLDFKQYVSFYNTTYFISTVMQLAADERYSHERMIRKLKYQVAKLQRQASVKQYLTLFTEIYNQRESDKNYVQFRSLKSLKSRTEEKKEG